MANTDNDRFAKTLKFKVLENRFGFSRIRGVVEDSCLNGVDIAHGGWLFSLADFALALATNTEERVAVSSASAIDYVNPCPPNAVVIAEAKMIFSNPKTAICDVELKSEDSATLYAVFHSRVIFKK